MKIEERKSAEFDNNNWVSLSSEKDLWSEEEGGESECRMVEKWKF